MFSIFSSFFKSTLKDLGGFGFYLAVLIGILLSIYLTRYCDNVQSGILAVLLAIIASFIIVFISMLLFSKGKKNDSSKEQMKTRTITKELTRDILAGLLDNDQTSSSIHSSNKHWESIEYKIGKMIVRFAPMNEIDDLLIKQEKSQIARSSIISKSINTAMGLLSDSEDLTLENENYIETLRKKYSLTVGEIQRLPNYTGYMKLLQVQDLLHGNVPKRFFNLTSPINLQKNETPIWEFDNATLYEEQVTRTMVGRSSGFSVRIAKGVYYRVGSFKGRPVVTTNLVPKYNGAMIITTKNIYFYSREKSIRLPFTKIVSFVDFEDGIGIQQDKQNAKPIYIQNIDGWLAFNIASNVNNVI